MIYGKLDVHRYLLVEHQRILDFQTPLVAGNVDAHHPFAPILFAQPQDVPIELGQAANTAEQRLNMHAEVGTTLREAA